MRPTTAILFCFALAACEKCALQDELPREQQARSWLAKGRAAVNKGDLAGAQQALEKAASYAPTDPEPQRTLGDVYEKLGQEAQAIFALKRAAELSPGDPEPRRELAELYLRAGKPASAVEHLKKAVEASQGTPEPELVRRLAWAHLRAGQVDEAEVVAARVDKAHPGDADTMALRAEILIAKRQEEEAVRLLDSAVEAHPDSARVRFARAKYFYSRGKVNEALREFELAAQAAPEDTDIGLARARALAAAGQVEEAAKLMDGIVASRPTDLNAQASLAEVKLLRKDVDGAREAAESVLSRQPKNGRALYVRARAIESQSSDDPVRAINAYREAIEADPDQTEALSRLWRLYEKQGQKADAMSALERLDLLGETTIEEQAELARIYADTGYNVPRGLRLIEDALKKDPGNEDLLKVKRSLEAKSRNTGTKPKGGFGVQVIKGSGGKH